jgi:hypothetical protein
MEIASSEIGVNVLEIDVIGAAFQVHLRETDAGVGEIGICGPDLSPEIADICVVSDDLDTFLAEREANLDDIEINLHDLEAKMDDTLPKVPDIQIDRRMFGLCAARSRRMSASGALHDGQGTW